MERKENISRKCASPKTYSEQTAVPCPYSPEWKRFLFRKIAVRGVSVSDKRRLQFVFLLLSLLSTQGIVLLKKNKEACVYVRNYLSIDCPWKPQAFIVSKQNSIGFFFDLIFISCQMLWLTTLLLNHTQVFGQSLVEDQHNLSKLRYSKQLRSYMKDKDEGELYKFVRRAYYYFRMNTNGICRCLYAVLFKECNVEWIGSDN